jgi:hypothetical protein
MADDKNVEFETQVEEAAEIKAVAKAEPVVQKIINPPSGLLVLVILIFLCLMVPVLFISGVTAWNGGGIRVLLAMLLCIVLPFMFYAQNPVQRFQFIVPDQVVFQRCDPDPGHAVDGTKDILLSAAAFNDFLCQIRNLSVFCAHIR